MNSKQDVSLNKTYKVSEVLKILVFEGVMTVAAVSQVFDVINPEFVTSSLDTEQESRPIKRAVKEAFHLPCRKLDSSVTDGDSSVWQTYRRAEQGDRPGTGIVAGILVEKWLAPGAGWPLQWQRGRSHNNTLCHTPVEEQWLAGRATPEKLPSGDGFHVNGRFNMHCVTALPAH